MPSSRLVTLKTDLKSLKYGHDRQGNGNSGQPYITTNIPNRYFTSPFDDGFIRGGWSLANKASNEDQLRISKFLDDKPKGPLFIQRQIGLQLTNPRIETRQINLAGFGLLGGLLTAGYNTFNQLLPGPTRLYNEGKNTLAQIPVNAFGTHFERHGLSPVQDDNTKYLAVAYNNNQNGNNRLVALKKKLIRPNITDPKSNNIILGTINSILGAVNVFNTIIGRGTNPLLPNSPLLQPADLIIDQYSGGPGSKYGVGTTVIRRYDVTSNGSNKPIPDKGKIDYAGGLGLSNLYFPKPNLNPEFNLIAGNFGIGQYGTPTDPVKIIDNNHIDLNNPTNKPSQLDQTVIDYGKGTYQAGANGTSNSPTTRRYNDLIAQIEKQSNISQSIENGLKSSNTFTTKTHIISKGTEDKSFKYNLTSLDTVHARKVTDILNIAFTIIDPFQSSNRKIITLPAYMQGFKDSFDATWNEFNYVGRAESFYTYNRYKRNISFNLDIPCFKKEELLAYHKRIGLLASTTAGSYNNGLLGGVLIRLNIGKYINGEYSILNNISYDVPNEASWDLDEKLAMYIKASFSFTIIHSQLPEYKSGDGFFPSLEDKLPQEEKY
jgi:hypothetical protein